MYATLPSISRLIEGNLIFRSVYILSTEDSVSVLFSALTQPRRKITPQTPQMITPCNYRLHRFKYHGSIPASTKRLTPQNTCGNTFARNRHNAPVGRIP